MKIDERLDARSYLMGLTFWTSYHGMFEALSKSEEIKKRYPRTFVGHAEGSRAILNNPEQREECVLSLDSLQYRIDKKIHLDQFHKRAAAMLNIIDTKVLSVVRLGIVGEYSLKISSESAVSYLRDKSLLNEKLGEDIETFNLFFVYVKDGHNINVNIMSGQDKRDLIVKLDINNRDISNVIEKPIDTLEKRINYFCEYLNSEVVRMIGG